MEFKKGDEVKLGELKGVVVDIDTTPEGNSGNFGHPVRVNWVEGGSEYFTLDGRISDSTTTPVLELAHRPKRMVKKKYFQAVIRYGNELTLDSRLYVSRKLAETAYAGLAGDVASGRWVEVEEEQDAN